MGEVSIPNLELVPALSFCKNLDIYEWDEANYFDFSKVSHCEPFTMLITGLKINALRKEHCTSKCFARGVHNTYAEHMRFFQFTGLNIGRDFSEDYGNSSYLPITNTGLQSIIEKSRKQNKRPGELITQASHKMATVLSNGQDMLEKVMTYAIREIIRNIFEHSNTYNGWYCAQRWPSKNIVEVAIADDGRGILESINSNYIYASKRFSNSQAILEALKPGVSRTYTEDNDREEIFASGNEWKNSGYGLYYVSRLCSKMKAC